MIKKFNIYRKNSVHRNPLPFPLIKWERVRDPHDEGSAGEDMDVENRPVARVRAVDFITLQSNYHSSINKHSPGRSVLEEYINLFLLTLVLTDYLF